MNYKLRTSTLASIWLALAVSSLFIGAELSLGLVKIRPFDLLLVVFTLFLIWAQTKNYYYLRPITPTSMAVSGCLILFAVSRLLSGIVTSSTVSAIKEATQFAEYILFFFVVVSITGTATSRDKFFQALFFCMLMIGLVNAALHVADGHFMGFKRNDEPKLVYGLSTLLSFHWYLRSRNNNDANKNFFTLIFWVSFLLMMLSGERKGWLAFLVSWVVYVYLSNKYCGLRFIALNFRGARVALVVGVLVAAIGVSALSGSGYLSKQIGSFNEIYTIVIDREVPQDMEDVVSRSNVARSFLLFFSFQMIRENPVFGVGTDQFKKHISQYTDDQWFVKGVHNEYLRILVENGVVGFFAFFLFLVVAVFSGIIKLRNSSVSDTGNLCLALALFFYGMVINFFLGGGALNILFYMLPAALLSSFGKTKKGKAFEQ